MVAEKADSLVNMQAARTVLGMGCTMAAVMVVY